MWLVNPTLPWAVAIVGKLFSLFEELVRNGKAMSINEVTNPIQRFLRPLRKNNSRKKVVSEILISQFSEPLFQVCNASAA